MPFKIVRNDITRVAADAIVNTANPEPCFGSGTDAAVYHAAGAEKMLAARKTIGRIAPGECAVTPAFGLPAKYVIHTVGPAWNGGSYGEFDILRSCYRNSLLLADQLGCESIAFPLIATGVYGFPKDKALEIALDVIRKHQESSDLDVTLVVFGRDSYQVAQGLSKRVEAYIDENYVRTQTAAEYGDERIRELDAQRRREYEASAAFRSQTVSIDAFEAPVPKAGAPSGAAMPAKPASPKPQAAAKAAMPPAPAPPKPQAAAKAAMPPAPGSAAYSRPAKRREDADIGAPALSSGIRKPSLDQVIRNLGESFQARLLRMIDERGLTDAEVYHRANISKQVFSKIRCSEDYIPKKKTVVALAVGLRLNLDDTKDLLAAAGFTLTNNSLFDVIVSFCIEYGIYDVYEINELLFKYDQPYLGTTMD